MDKNVSLSLVLVNYISRLQLVYWTGNVISLASDCDIGDCMSITDKQSIGKAKKERAKTGDTDTHSIQVRVISFYLDIT